MARKIIESIYYRTAMWMPLRYDWQWAYIGNARAYFEVNKEPGFSGWPWGWSVCWPEEVA
jgi:hypothetical protein